jgi:molybdopterin/thiamine biosynthesis adenylyltransferase
MRDFNRQGDLIDPDEFKGVTITIIGAGATGSHVALNLAQMGIGYKGNGLIKVYDFDEIEAHNIQNQAFWPKHIGMPKVTALAEMLKERFEVEIEANNFKVTDQKEIQSNYVFLLTDTMSSRTEIMENAMKYAVNTDLVIETRMGLEDGRVYAFNPNNQDHLEAWKSTLYSDDEAEVSLCGTSSSIVNTTQFLTALAVSRLIQHFRQEKSELLANTKLDKQPMWNESIFKLHPESFMVSEFGQPAKMLD